MVSRRAYKRVKVNAVEVDSLLSAAIGKHSAVLGLDIGKDEIVACLRWGMDDYERPWSVCNPVEIRELVELCKKIVNHGVELTIALESTGTYGDCVRLAMTKAGLSIKRIGGKHVSDYAEAFDGVPSQHDGKDAAVIAELCAIGKGVPWPYESRSEELAEIGFHVRRMDVFQGEIVQWSGRLESHLSRHWPELSKLVKPGRISILSLLLKYGGPDLVSTSQSVVDEITSWSKGQMSQAKACSIVHSAETTLGVPMTSQDKQWLQEICQRILNLKRSMSACDKKLRVLLKKDAFWSRYVDSVSAGTLGVILSAVGDPRQYASAGALVKACGLNLKELSSGQRVGEKAISKRGPSIVRRWLYFWALRSVQREELREWYHRFHNQGYGVRDRPSKHRKMKGIICLMRKLLRSLWSSVQQGQPFEYSKVVRSLAKPKRRRRRKTQKSAMIDSDRQ
jgi:transposase